MIRVIVVVLCCSGSQANVRVAIILSVMMLTWWLSGSCSDSCRREDSHVSVNSGNMIITIWVFSVSRQISLIGVWSSVRTSESHLYVTLTCFMATVSVIIMYRTSCYVLGFCTAARSMRSANSGKHSTHLRPLCAHDTKIMAVGYRFDMGCSFTVQSESQRVRSHWFW